MAFDFKIEEHITMNNNAIQQHHEGYDLLFSGIHFFRNIVNHNSMIPWIN
jgi:hypothetical protein